MKTKGLLLSALIAVLCLSCNYNSDRSSHENEAFSVKEAKTLFENSVAVGVLSRTSDVETSVSPIRPGDFTPKWDEAITSQTANLAYVEVPIYAQFKHTAWRPEVHNKKVKMKRVSVHQKLVMVKELASETTGTYILTLIPTRDFYKSNKHDFGSRFSCGGNKRDFSGTVIYSTIDGIPLRINQYINGEKARGVFMLTTPMEIAQNVEKGKKMLQGVKISTQEVSPLSRSFEEEDEEYEEDDSSDFASWFEDYYNSTDSNFDIDFTYDAENDSWTANVYDEDGNLIEQKHFPDTDDSQDEGSWKDDLICSTCQSYPCMCAFYGYGDDDSDNSSESSSNESHDDNTQNYNRALGLECIAQMQTDLTTRSVLFYEVSDFETCELNEIAPEYNQGTLCDHCNDFLETNGANYALDFGAAMRGATSYASYQTVVFICYEEPSYEQIQQLIAQISSIYDTHIAAIPSGEGTFSGDYLFMLSGLSAKTL